MGSPRNRADAPSFRALGARTSCAGSRRPMERAHVAVGHAKSLGQALERVELLEERVDLLEVGVDFSDACEVRRGRRGQGRRPASRRASPARRRSHRRRASAASTPTSCSKCSLPRSERYRLDAFRRAGRDHSLAKATRRRPVPQRTSTDRCGPAVAARATHVTRNPPKTPADPSLRNRRTARSASRSAPAATRPRTTIPTRPWVPPRPPTPKSANTSSTGTPSVATVACRARILPPRGLKSSFHHGIGTDSAI